MFIVRLVIGLASFGVVGWLTYDFLTSYLHASGSRWTRFQIAFKGSMTIAWQRFVMAVTFMTSGLVELADYFNLPGVGDALRQYLTPSTVMIMMAAVAIVSEFTRRRTL